MSISVQVIFGILIALAYLGSPVGLIWGWAHFVRRPKPRTVTSILSLAGFVLATTSALLAFVTVVYAHIHTFRYYDPLLLRIFRAGFLLSLSGILIGVAGMWRPSSLRWHAPLCGVATAAFWVLAAEGE